LPSRLGEQSKLLVTAVKDTLSVVSIVFGLVLAGSRFLTGSDAGAKEFLRSQPDPLGALTRHIERLFLQTRHNVAVFVDDIDRCDPVAVVRVLEGIQTIFGSAPIVFVVAGDGRWIERAFEKTYGDNAPQNPRTAVGQTLGGLFVEKLFQISVAVPDMPLGFKTSYWRQLLGLEDRKLFPMQPDATSRISGLQSEEAILQVVAEVDPRENPQEALLLRDAAIRRLAQPDLIERPSVHVMEIFVDSVEANPRAMKRQVMAYGMARAFDLASFRTTPQRTLAAWSVLSLRWPVLAEWLRENPERICMAASEQSGELERPEDRPLVALMKTPEARLLTTHLSFNALRLMMGQEVDDEVDKDD
jgi:hypothetical protein